MWCWFYGTKVWLRSFEDADPTIASPTRTLFRANSPNTISAAISSGSVSGHYFENLKFEATNAPIYYSVSGTGSLNNIIIKGCEFYQIPEPLFASTSSNPVGGITLEDCTIEYGRIVFFSTSNSTTRELHNLTIKNNKCTNYNYKYTLSNIFQIKNSARYDAECIYFQSPHNSICSNNTIEGLWGTKYDGGDIPTSRATGIVVWHGSAANTKNNIISGNYISGFKKGQYGITLGAGLTDVCRNNYVVGNKIVVSGDGSLVAGINYSDAATVNDNYIVNNIIVGADTNYRIDSSGERGTQFINNISLNPVNYHIECANTTVAQNDFNNNYYFPITGTPFKDGTVDQTYAVWSADRSDTSITTEQILDANYEATYGSLLDQTGIFIADGLRDIKGRLFKSTPPIGAYEIHGSGGVAQLRAPEIYSKTIQLTIGTISVFRGFVIGQGSLNDDSYYSRDISTLTGVTSTSNLLLNFTDLKFPGINNFKVTFGNAGSADLTWVNFTSRYESDQNQSVIVNYLDANVGNTIAVTITESNI
jgi:hypothetical protein